MEELSPTAHTLSYAVTNTSVNWKFDGEKVLDIIC